MQNAAARVESDEATVRALHTHNLGVANFTTVPHHIEGIGPRLFLIFDERGSHYNLNLHPRCARRAAMCLNAAANEAEALERRAQHGEAVETAHLGNIAFIAVAQFVPSVGPQIILMFDETNSHYRLPVIPANARLLSMCLTTAACEAEALERKARERAKRQAEQRAATPKP